MAHHAFIPGWSPAVPVPNVPIEVLPRTIFERSNNHAIRVPASHHIETILSPGELIALSTVPKLEVVQACGAGNVQASGPNAPFRMPVPWDDWFMPFRVGRGGKSVLLSKNQTLRRRS